MKLSCPQAYLSHYLQMRNSTKKAILEKKITFALFLSGPFPSEKKKKAVQKADSFVSTHFRQQKKKACGICLAIFQKGSETGVFKRSRQFSSSGWVRLNMPFCP